MKRPIFAITYSECVFADLGILHKMRICHNVVRGLPDNTIFFYKSHKQRDLKKKCF
jgi:hypothetical protein